MTDILVRIESIYDLSLGKILNDTGKFTVLSPHNLNSNQHEASNIVLPHDVHIGDLDKRIGVQIKGISSAVKLIENTIQNHLPDSILFKHGVQQDAIYFAKVIKHIYRKKLAILDLGGEKNGILFNYEGQQGQSILVQIKELTTEKDKLPVCSDLLTLSGNYVILEVGSSFVRVSRKIKGRERKRLHDIGKELLPDGFGIIVRTSANNIDQEELRFEIDQLISLWSRIKEDIEDDREPRRLVTGEVQSEIIFGHESKTFFDKIRTELVPTIPNYHHFKSYSFSTGFTLDFAQNFMNKISAEEMSNTLSDMIMKRDYPINNHIKAEFHYADGVQEEVNLGDIVENNIIFITKKSMTPNDVSSVQSLDLTANDIMEVIFTPGSWTIHYKYYSALTGDLLGERVRITTPIDLIYRGRIRTFDMGMNIYYDVNKDEIIKSLTDHTELDMVEQHMITQKLNDTLGAVLRYSLEKLEDREKYIIYN